MSTINRTKIRLHPSRVKVIDETSNTLSSSGGDGFHFEVVVCVVWNKMVITSSVDLACHTGVASDPRCNSAKPA